MSIPSPVNSTGYGTVTPAVERLLERVELLARPPLGEEVLAIVGHALDGALVAAVPEAAALVVQHVVGEGAAAGEAEALDLALADLHGSVALVGEERGVLAVERAPLDDEHLGLLAGLEQPEDLVLGAACGEPRRSGAVGVVLEHGSSRGCDAVRAPGPDGSQGAPTLRSARGAVGAIDGHGHLRRPSSRLVTRRLRQVGGDSLAPGRREGKRIRELLAAGRRAVYGRPSHAYEGDRHGWSSALGIRRGCCGHRELVRLLQRSRQR